MEEVLMDILTEEKDLLHFIERLVKYWLESIYNMIEAGVDVIVFGDDWGTQNSSLIPPSLFRSMFKPYYETLMVPIRQAGRKIFFHSCGFLGEILDDLIDLGINGLWPQITLLNSNPLFLEKCWKHNMTIYIHPDRQHLVPRGTPEEIEAAIRRSADRHHHLQGGGIFSIEIENDVPFKNVKALVEAVHKWR
jgi:uroporphyrinogen decarboxylase